MPLDKKWWHVARACALGGAVGAALGAGLMSYGWMIFGLCAGSITTFVSIYLGFDPSSTWQSFLKAVERAGRVFTEDIPHFMIDSIEGIGKMPRLLWREIIKPRPFVYASAVLSTLLAAGFIYYLHHNVAPIEPKADLGDDEAFYVGTVLFALLVYAVSIVVWPILQFIAYTGGKRTNEYWMSDIDRWNESTDKYHVFLLSPYDRQNMTELPLTQWNMYRLIMVGLWDLFLSLMSLSWLLLRALGVGTWTFIVQLVRYVHSKKLFFIAGMASLGTVAVLLAVSQYAPTLSGEEYTWTVAGGALASTLLGVVSHMLTPEYEEQEH